MSDARTVLKRYGLLPKKSFGQNFLVAQSVVDAIARACVPNDEVGRARVVELGAGHGVLSRALAGRAAHVDCVERDRDLVPILEAELADAIESGVCRIREGDAQAVSLHDLLGDAPPRVLCGNLPYQITGRLLERAVQQADSVERVVFMIQLEVAERLTAPPGEKEYGALTVFVSAAFRAKKLFNVSPGSFFPAPDVTSAVVLLEPHRPRRAAETETFRAVVKAAFGMRRKTLRNALRSVADRDVVTAAAERADVSLDARGETLDVDAFARLASALDDLRGPGASSKKTAPK